MTDRISSLPDSILCHILFFLPTTQVFATRLLSKRWNLLWLKVPSFDFDHHDADIIDYDKLRELSFLQSVYSFLLCRDMSQPFQRLRLRCCSFCYPLSIKTWIKAAMLSSGTLEHLDLNLNRGIVVPSVVFTCKTLVILKLACLTVQDMSFVDLPLLKILHLNSVFSSDGLDLSHLFFGSRNLEDLEAKDSFIKEGKFNRPTKLVRANTHGKLVPLEIVKNVEVLLIDWIHQEQVFDFLNLIKLELKALPYKEFVKVLEVLNHCPKLQTLVIGIYKVSFDDSFFEGHKKAVLPYPQSVPECISLHLKTCRLENYSGSIDEFQFASYIMQNAEYLQTMKICFARGYGYTYRRVLNMRSELSSCMKSSDACTLSFE